MRRLAFATLAVIGVVLGALVTGMVFGEHPLIGDVEAKTPPKPASEPAVDAQRLYLIRSSLGALHDANRTGNYSVLRDLSAPSFQARYSPADLAELFAPARRQPIDLSEVAYVTPVVTETARPDPGRLSLSGTVSSAGDKVRFTLLFEAVHGHWRFAGVSLTSAQAAQSKSPPAVKP